MASLSEDDKRRGAKAIADALMSEERGADDRAAPAAGSPAAAAAANPKRFFCDNWATVRAVLAILRQFAPAGIRPLIDIVIRVGDALKAAICR